MINIDKSKTISDEKIAFHRDILKAKLSDSRLPRENILTFKVSIGEIKLEKEVLKNE